MPRSPVDEEDRETLIGTEWFWLEQKGTGLQIAGAKRGMKLKRSRIKFEAILRKLQLVIACCLHHL